MSERKVKYSKFFPDSCMYISVVGRSRSHDDYDVSLDIGDGSGKVSFFLSDFYKKEAVAQLKAMQDAVKAALDFYEAASNMPPAQKKPAAKKSKKAVEKQ